MACHHKNKDLAKTVRHDAVAMDKIEKGWHHTAQRKSCKLCAYPKGVKNKGLTMGNSEAFIFLKKESSCDTGKSNSCPHLPSCQWQSRLCLLSDIDNTKRIGCAGNAKGHTRNHNDGLAGLCHLFFPDQIYRSLYRLFIFGFFLMGTDRPP